MSELVTSMMFKWLLPVRGESRFVHYVLRDERDPLSGFSLCGQLGEPNRYGVAKFRRLKSTATPGGICNVCHAEACRKPTRVDWQG